MEIILEPNPDHCIHSAAKREYEAVLRTLLKGVESEDLADKLELLRIFLESADFRELRSRCDKFLLVGRHVRAKLKSTVGSPGYEIEINPVV